MINKLLKVQVNNFIILARRKTKNGPTKEGFQINDVCSRSLGHSMVHRLLWTVIGYL